jgi:hypothetical protein
MSALAILFLSNLELAIVAIAISVALFCGALLWYSRLLRLKQTIAAVHGLIRNKQWGPARERVEIALRRYPANTELLNQLMLIEQGLKAPEIERSLPAPTAFETLPRTSVDRQGDLEVLAAAVRERMAAGDLVSAEQVLLEAKSTLSDDPAWHDLYGELKARQQYEYDAVLNQALRLIKQADFKAAAALLKEVTAWAPDDRARNLLLEVLHQRNRLEEQQNELRERQGLERLRGAEHPEGEYESSLREQERLRGYELREEHYNETLYLAIQRWLTNDLDAAEVLLRRLASEAKRSPIQPTVELFLRALQQERERPDITDFVHQTVDHAYRLAAERQFESALQRLEEAFRKLAHPLFQIAFAQITAARQEESHLLLETRTQIPADIRIDDVHFTITAPGALERGAASDVQFWVHVERQRRTVLQQAHEAHGHDEELITKSEGPFPLKRGSRISVRLRIEGLKCVDNHKWIMWTGAIGSANFVVIVPSEAPEGTYVGSASVRLNGCQIAKMSFVLLVGSKTLPSAAVPSETTTYRNAFASYASVDRGEVLARVQGMEAAYKGLKVFVDVVDLRSAQYWQTELPKRICVADVFYLFWCRHAKSSEWVDREWHWALQAKGLDFIDPVPLEGPEYAPPPAELATKHFNDPLLAFIAVAGGGTHSRA